MGNQLFLSLAVAALLLSGCVQVVKNEPAPTAPVSPQSQDPAKAPTKAPVPAAPKPASRPAGEPLPLDLTQVQHESGKAPPELPLVGQEGHP